jgi:hypothetical protein
MIPAGDTLPRPRCTRQRRSLWASSCQSAGWARLEGDLRQAAGRPPERVSGTGLSQGTCAPYALPIGNVRPGRADERRAPWTSRRTWRRSRGTWGRMPGMPPSTTASSTSGPSASGTAPPISPPRRNLHMFCLQLGFYLASWGMLRGSSTLLCKSTRHYEPVINGPGRSRRH